MYLPAVLRPCHTAHVMMAHEIICGCFVTYINVRRLVTFVEEFETIPSATFDWVRLRSENVSYLKPHQITQATNMWLLECCLFVCTPC
jgi:hypothetical protein